ncbi:hypothetical protein WKR98_02940 [Pigmentiphaga sp. YJ18]|uniref:hypothetical protein n=1 Tax=Pigmentiphaga sp. YJ18 TaxID=3134907 RepID=UPI003114269B
MNANLPKEFEMLEPLVAEWALPTQNQRQVRRKAATRGELQYFYDNMLPRMPAILRHVDTYPLGELPEDAARLFSLALSMAEVAPHIELYGGSPGVPYAFEESRFVAEHGEQRL